MDIVFRFAAVVAIGVAAVEVLANTAYADEPPAEVAEPTTEAYGPLDADQADAYASQMADLDGLRLDINRASSEALQDLPWITPDLAGRIVSERNRLGGFSRVRGLSRIDGVSPELLAALSPHLTVQAPRSLDVSYTGRVTRPAGEPDAWPGLRVYHRLQAAFGQRVSAFLLVERDPAEPGLADFASGHLILRNTSGSTQIVLGDFLPGFGQGLVLSRQSRSGSDLASARPGSAGRLGYTSSLESGSFRGICGQWVTGRWRLLAFWAGASWDARVDEDGLARVVQSGEHRSEAQIQQKHALTERAHGARLGLNLAAASIGVSAVRSTYSAPVAAAGRPSRRHLHAALDWHLRWPRGETFGEWARAPGGPGAWMAGARTPAGRLRLSIVARRYGPGFGHVRGGAFGAYSGPPDNEWGLFLGAAWRVRPGTRLEAGVDRHGRIVPEGSASVPGRGSRLDIRYSQRASHSAQIHVGFRHDRETVTAQDHTGRRVRRRLQAQVRVTHGPLTARPWASVGASRAPDGGGTGAAAGLLCALRSGRGLQLDGWLSAFRVTDYDARVYTGSPAVWGGGRLTVLSGTGHAAGWKAAFRLRGLQVAARMDWKRTEAGRSSSWGLQLGVN